MIRVLAVILLVAATQLGACTNRGVYEGIQTSNRIECGQLPPSQYDECMERSSLSYEEYERQRAEVSKQQ